MENKPLTLLCNFRVTLHYKWAFRQYNFVKKKFVAQEKLHRKLQARAIILTVVVGFLLHGFLLRATFLPSISSTFIEGGVWHALYTLAFVFERLSTLSQQLFILQRI